MQQGTVRVIDCRNTELHLKTAKMEAASLEPANESVLTPGLGVTDDREKTLQEKRMRKKDHVHSVSVAFFTNHVKWLHANDNDGFESEFKAIGEEKNCTCREALLYYNIPKNRYLNVSYDHSRVKLQSVGEVGSDYINASWVNGSQRKNEYIAAQGPLEDTVTDMWRMVWENRIPAIIMLTALIERGKQKCVEYWPTSPATPLRCEVQHGRLLVVRLVESESHRHWEEKTLTIEDTSVKEQAVHTVQHYQFISWPDHGAPSTPLPVLGFLRHIRTAHPPSGPPLLVHCSAGVGRTGTLIALDSLLQELEEGWKEVNVFETVRRMRRSRPSMVQSLVQYMFLHSALLHTITHGNKQPQDFCDACELLSYPVHCPAGGCDDTLDNHSHRARIPQSA